MIATRPLATTGLRVSEFGLGAAALGNLYAPVNDTDARATINAALAAGITLVDVAPHYGMGLAERRVGDAIRGRQAALSTKVGRLLDPAPDAQTGEARHGFVSPMPFEPRYDYTGAGILRSHEASLQRLGLARVDLLLVHDIGALTHGADAARRMGELVEGGGIAALERLKQEGAIAGWGLGVNEVAVCLELLKHARPDVILLAGRYTLLEQGALDAFFPAAEAADCAVLIGGPFNSGVLAGSDTYDYQQAPPHVVAKVKAIDAVCRRHDVALPAAALRFVLAHPQVASVLSGARHPDEIKSNLRHLNAEIPAAFWRDLKDAGLIAAEAPAPA